MKSPWRDAALETNLRTIGELLRRNEVFWRPQAFTHLQMPWEPAYPALAQELRALSIDQSEQLAAEEAALCEFLRGFIKDAADILQSAAVPSFPLLQDFSSVAVARDVPGRKWQQIVEFASVLPGNPSPILEWCSGKAHLSQLLARTQRCEVAALEWNADLIADGSRLAQRDNLPICFYQVDAMSPLALTYLHSAQRVVALHACGDLHAQLLRGCAQQKSAAIALAPCCYHLTQQQAYQPLSRSAARHDLVLTRDDLRTAVQGSVTSSMRVQRQRKQLQAWRLGFDMLRRELCGTDEYLATPSLPVSVLRDGFPAFCRRLAQHCELTLPATLGYLKYERIGAERLRLVTALDLPRLLFRRALEVWLALDRALYLRESGYVVELGTFCARQLTPRNLLISARYRGAEALCSQ